MSDGRVEFDVVGNTRGIRSAIDEATSHIQKQTKKWDDAAENAADGMESSFSSALKKIAAGFSAVKIGKALLDIGKQAIQAASDLEEVQNVVDVTFGQSGADQIQKWADQAGKQFGLTETQAKKFTSTLGAMMKSAGIAGPEIVNMSTDLAGLAADMASFYNLDFETAFQKIRSGISGETEPLKQLGINMSVANLEAYALSQGITKAFNDMSQGEQTMLRYQYLMQATADAQGDFARTSDGYANSLRQMETNIDSLKTKLGQILLPEISKTVSALNEMLDLIAPVKEQTVMDQIANVQLKTAEKIDQIDQTATKARSLLEQLTAIENTKAGDGVQKVVDKLSKVDLTQGNMGVFNEFLSTLYANIEDVASVRGESVDEAKAWLDGLAASANSLDPGKAEDWKMLLQAITSGLPGIEETEDGKSIIDALELESSSIGRYLEALGIDSSNVANKQELWLEVCRRLVQTIPGLSSIINTQTGEIKGGTQAIADYIDQWQEAEEKAALLEEIAQERKILSERYSDRFSLKVDVVEAEAEVDRLQKKLDSFDESIRKSADQKDMQQALWGGAANYTQEEQDYLDTMVALSKAKQDLSEKQTKLNGYMGDYEAAVAKVEKREQAVIDKYGEIEQATDGVTEATMEWTEEEKKAATEAVNAANEALKAMADYAENVHTAVENSVNSTIKGFEKMVTPSQTAANKASELTAKLAEMGERTEKNATEWDKLNAQIQEYNSQTVSTKNMQEGLQSQLDFMDEYLKALEAAKTMGLSTDLISYLSDGSMESLDWLKELTDPKNAQAAGEISKKWDEVQQKKAAFTDTLTESQLSMDETFQAMKTKAEEAVAALDLQGQASENAGKTIQGIAEGISSNVPAVASAVDSIIAELDRLNGLGFSLDLGPLGTFGFSIDGSHATGLDYVPFDHYLAELHAGEGILTAEENKIWQNFKKGDIGSRNTDYDTLGSVIGDNVHAGGDVFLDGRTVGKVISDMQGRSFRSLQRSGWQS